MQIFFEGPSLTPCSEYHLVASEPLYVPFYRKNNAVIINFLTLHTPRDIIIGCRTVCHYGPSTSDCPLTRAFILEANSLPGLQWPKHVRDDKSHVQTMLTLLRD